MRRLHAMPFGAEAREDGSVRFRLWAPAARTVDLCSPETVSMELLPGGWFERIVDDAGPGTLYRYRIDGRTMVPDPASRFQPRDVHGPSEVVDPRTFAWPADDWRGRPWDEAVLYELHLGCFTPDGTYRGAVKRLDHLVDLGVTAIELMPLSDTAGARNWGYDGALPFAPDSRHGRPDDLKAFVQAAHQRGLMVFLDVVYNHFGPEGNYLYGYAPQFFTERHQTPWGAAIDFDGPDSLAVRDFVIHNALYWIEEFHLDGLRLDAVHAIHDTNRPHILEELAETVSDHVARSRHVHLVLENDANQARYLGRDKTGRPRHYVAQWADDIHHGLHVLVTGESDGYYADFADVPARHLARSLAEGFAYQGDIPPGGRGEPSDHLPPTAFVTFLQNHDQVGNRAFGERITAVAEPRAVKAAVAVLLLAPHPPLLFMGEEWGAGSLFPFFCDFEGELARLVTQGRRREFAHFARFSREEDRERIPDPNAEGTFNSAVLDWNEIGTPPHTEWLAFYRLLLRLRNEEIVPLLAKAQGNAGDFAVFGDTAFSVRWVLAGNARLWLAANLGSDATRVDPIQPPGRLLFATENAIPDHLARGILPAWSVAWFLDP